MLMVLIDDNIHNKYPLEKFSAHLCDWEVKNVNDNHNYKMQFSQLL